MVNTPKKYGTVLSFAPLTAYTLWSIYFLVVTGGYVEMSSAWNHFKWMTATLANYDVLLWTFLTCALITTIVLLYYTVHLARIKTMPAGNKIAWMVFMVIFGAFSFPVFWYAELRHEPEQIDVYPDIA
jgi:uncharacterized membrane protein